MGKREILEKVIASIDEASLALYHMCDDETKGMSENEKNKYFNEHYQNSVKSLFDACAIIGRVISNN